MFRRERETDNYQIGEKWMLLLLSLPYLIDLVIGIYGCVFAVTLLEPGEARQREEQQFNQELEEFKQNNADQEM